jgi:hypothetical protein
VYSILSLENDQMPNLKKASAIRELEVHSITEASFFPGIGFDCVMALSMNLPTTQF